MDLKIAYIDYSINTRSLDIFTIGCNGCCHNCCNPEIKNWDIDGLSVNQAILKLKNLCKDFDKTIDRFIIVGGDPCDAELMTKGQVSLFIDKIKSFSKKPIYLFTRHKLEDIPLSLKDKCDYIKTGEYIEELNVDNNIQYGIKLATSNQHIYRMERAK
jgi:anaerobic ribonucleoside-triphosphate reductase activating protein